MTANINGGINTLPSTVSKSDTSTNSTNVNQSAQVTYPSNGEATGIFNNLASKGTLVASYIDKGDGTSISPQGARKEAESYAAKTRAIEEIYKNHRNANEQFNAGLIDGFAGDAVSAYRHAKNLPDIPKTDAYKQGKTAGFLLSTGVPFTKLPKALTTGYSVLNAVAQFISIQVDK